MAGQLAGRQDEDTRCNNPCPQAVIRPGSGTDVLLRFLRQAPGRWVFHSELVLALGRSKGEIDWALLYLVREDQVETRLTELPSRKPVLRYRLREAGQSNRIYNMTKTTERQPQAGDIYAYRENGAVLFIASAHQLTTWRGANPFQDKCRRPLGHCPDMLHKIVKLRGLNRNSGEVRIW